MNSVTNNHHLVLLTDDSIDGKESGNTQGPSEARTQVENVTLVELSKSITGSSGSTNEGFANDEFFSLKKSTNEHLE